MRSGGGGGGGSVVDSTPSPKWPSRFGSPLLHINCNDNLYLILPIDCYGELGLASVQLDSFQRATTGRHAFVPICGL